MARRATQQTAQWLHLPAPIGGLNTIAPGTALPPEDALVLYNLISAEQGLRVRLGYVEWVTGMTGTGNNQVRSVLPFTGATSSKLWATTTDGIWDCTVSTAAPSTAFTFGTKTGNAGYGVGHVAVTAAGHFHLYCDEVNGYHIYPEGGAWAAVPMGGGAGEVSGVNPADLRFVTVHKNRAWFVEKDSARAWYLGLNSVYGAATSFNFAGRFRQGGYLVGLWSWTVDGGTGLDDYLVAISSAGDVVVYQGTDPSSASTWGVRGVWNVGGVPAGRHIAAPFGGDLLILTTTGIVPMSKLVLGNPVIDRSQYSTAKISNLWNKTMASRASLPGWSLRLQPEDNALIVTVPTESGAATEQFVMSLASRSWFRYRDLPIYSADSYGNTFYFGTTDGKLCRQTGYVDGVSLAAPDTYTPVQYSAVMAFRNVGGRKVWADMCRLVMVSEGVAPSVSVAARFDGDTTELDPVAFTPSSSSAAWDSAIWDQSLWGGDFSPSVFTRGLTGCGSHVAIAIRGAAASRTVLEGVDVSVRAGGFL